MANTETTVSNLKINRLTQTQLENASSLSNTEAYWVDPEFTGGKILATDSNGDIVESALTPSSVGTVKSVNNTSPDSNGNVAITIPTVNNATLTIQKNSTNVATFTANASSNVTANISVPTDTNDLSNGAGYITGITSTDVTTALGYTPYDSSNPNGYTSNTGTVTSVNNISPTNGNVSLTIPSDTNDLTNGAGFITSSALTSYQLIAQPITTLSTSGTIALSDNTINSITPTGNVTFTLPTISDNSKFHQILVQVNLSTPYSITLGTTYYFNKKVPDLSSAGLYNIIYEVDKATNGNNGAWVVGVIPKGTV